MPRKDLAIPPDAPERAARASRRAILDSPLWSQADALGGPWDLTRRLFDQHRMVRHVQGDFSQAVALARALYVGQLRFTADLFYQGDRRIQAHWAAGVAELRDYLDGVLERSVGVFSHRPVVITSPRGAPLGSKREHPRNAAWATTDLLVEFRRAVADLSGRYQREKTKRPNWTKDIATRLGVQPATVLRYLERHPELQDYLDEARGTNKGVS